MFPEGAPDMQQIMAQAQAMQQQLMQIQAEIQSSLVVGEAAGGLVKATIKGSGEVVALDIDPKVVDPEDVETLQDLVIGALNDASAKAQQLASDKLGPMAGALGGSMPGLPDF